MNEKPSKKSSTVQKYISDKGKSEAEVVKICNMYLKKNGWYPHTMFTGGIPIGDGKYATNPCKGIPDCIAFNPGLKVLLWIEYKKEIGGILSDEQKIWHERLKRTNQHIFVVNSLHSLKEQLAQEGLVNAQSGKVQP